MFLISCFGLNFGQFYVQAVNEITESSKIAKVNYVVFRSYKSVSLFDAMNYL